ncbi:MAG TPA: MFS transporter [Gemmatimonadaceae bacterium]|nr:MFS transporter [Gemmatimonadaceae bacterium]
MRNPLDRLGLRTREQRAWAMYDWGISGVQTTIAAAIFPFYFAQVIAAHVGSQAAQGRYALLNSISIAIVAMIAPILGTLADYIPVKKRLLGGFTVVGSAFVAGLYLVQGGQLLLGSILFVGILVASTGAMVFYEALLPHIAGEEEMDRVSAAGYALGYLGGGLLLALNAAWIVRPDLFGLPSGPDLSPAQATLPARLAFLSVTVWWLLFTVPLMRRVPEPVAKILPDEDVGVNPIRISIRRLYETFRDLRGYKQAFLMLLAFLLYNDGIATVQRMAVIYGSETLGLGAGALIGGLLLAQMIGVPFTFLFGLMGGWLGTRRAIFVGIASYIVIVTFAFFMQTATHFFILAGMVGLVQGGTQALSRSLFARLIPRHRSGEFFGFYSVFNKFAGIVGPLIFWAALEVFDSSRPAILSVIVLFVAGGILLGRVKVAEGEAAARAAEAEARVVA